jgi:hypothetical protein
MHTPHNYVVHRHYLELSKSVSEFRLTHVQDIAKSNYVLRHVCPSVSLSAGTEELGSH